MIKLAGSFLIMAGSLLCGLKGAAYLRERVDCLESVIASLTMMENEICERLTPIPELAEMMAEGAPKPARYLFENMNSLIGSIGDRSFAEIWKESVIRTPQLLLTPQETLCLSQLGFFLGKYSLEQQKSAIDSTKSKMREFLSEAQRRRRQNSKLSAFVGLASGMLAVIVLI